MFVINRSGNMIEQIGRLGFWLLLIGLWLVLVFSLTSIIPDQTKEQNLVILLDVVLISLILFCLSDLMFGHFDQLAIVTAYLGGLTVLISFILGFLFFIEGLNLIVNGYVKFVPIFVLTSISAILLVATILTIFEKFNLKVMFSFMAFVVCILFLTHLMIRNGMDAWAVVKFNIVVWLFSPILGTLIYNLVNRNDINLSNPMIITTIPIGIAAGTLIGLTISILVTFV